MDDLADLYAIIRSTESLERAYARDLVTADEVSDERLVSFLHRLFVSALPKPALLTPFSLVHFLLHEVNIAVQDDRSRALVDH